jgi:hypothetical protein
MISFFIYLYLGTIGLWGMLFIINIILDSYYFKFIKKTMLDVGIVWYILLLIFPIANLFLIFFELLEFIDNIKYQLWKLKNFNK